MQRFKKGQLVVCIKDESNKHPEILHAVGEIIEVFTGALRWTLKGQDYAVHFPSLEGCKCSQCGQDHKGLYPMLDQELKPLDDPDEGAFEWYQEKEPIKVPAFGFSIG